MVINAPVLISKSNTVKAVECGYEGASFKSILASKKTAKIGGPTMVSITQKKPLPSINEVVGKLINNHELATKSVRTAMVRTNYTPEQLLGLQYKTGMFFMAEQMFCKTAELSVNTFKNFTQMQV